MVKQRPPVAAAAEACGVQVALYYRTAPRSMQPAGRLPRVLTYWRAAQAGMIATDLEIPRRQVPAKLWEDSA